MNIEPLRNEYKDYRVIKPGVIEGYWNEDLHPFEITCPPQLQDMLVFLLNSLSLDGKKIVIQKSSCADTRTCDYTKVSKEKLLDQSKQHIRDVELGILYMIAKLRKASSEHDRTKISDIDHFHSNFKTGFKDSEWWNMHQITERHHFNTPEFIHDDINLVDVIEQIVDGVMAGIARSGEYRYEPLSSELLQKAYNNTAKLLIENVELIAENDTK